MAFVFPWSSLVFCEGIGKRLWGVGVFLFSFYFTLFFASLSFFLRNASNDFFSNYLLTSYSRLLPLRCVSNNDCGEGQKSITDIRNTIEKVRRRLQQATNQASEAWIEQGK